MNNLSKLTILGIAVFVSQSLIAAPTEIDQLTCPATFEELTKKADQLYPGYFSNPDELASKCYPYNSAIGAGGATDEKVLKLCPCAFTFKNVQYHREGGDPLKGPHPNAGRALLKVINTKYPYIDPNIR